MSLLASLIPAILGTVFGQHTDPATKQGQGISADAAQKAGQLYGQFDQRSQHNAALDTEDQQALQVLLHAMGQGGSGDFTPDAQTQNAVGAMDRELGAYQNAQAPNIAAAGNEGVHKRGLDVSNLNQDAAFQRANSMRDLVNSQFGRQQGAAGQVLNYTQERRGEENQNLQGALGATQVLAGQGSQLNQMGQQNQANANQQVADLGNVLANLVDGGTAKTAVAGTQPVHAPANNAATPGVPQPSFTPGTPLPALTYPGADTSGGGAPVAPGFQLPANSMNWRNLGKRIPIGSGY